MLGELLGGVVSDGVGVFEVAVGVSGSTGATCAYAGLPPEANVNASASAVESGMQEIVKRMRAAIPGVRVIGATLTSALGARGGHGSAEEDEKRKALNAFIRTSGLFDGVADFDKATIDAETGGLRPEFVPESTTGGAGDRLHPNRAGYLAMGMALDLRMLMR